MVNEYGEIYLNSTLLPDYIDIALERSPNASSNVTLGGTLFVDYVNNRRVWTIQWQLLTREQVQIIIDLYNSQYSTGTNLVMEIPQLGTITDVYMTISTDQIKYNGQYSESFSAVIQEIYAVS